MTLLRQTQASISRQVSNAEPLEAFANGVFLETSEITCIRHAPATLSGGVIITGRDPNGGKAIAPTMEFCLAPLVGNRVIVLCKCFLHAVQGQSLSPARMRDRRSVTPSLRSPRTDDMSSILPNRLQRHCRRWMLALSLESLRICKASLLAVHQIDRPTTSRRRLSRSS